jgi:hypothetical protein
MTTKYYLDFYPGDTILFAKNVIHMSDYRDSSNKRKTFNFRVILKDNGNINISPSKCGYVHELNL